MRKYAYSASLVAEELLLGALLFIPRPLNRPVVGMLMLDCEVCSRGVLLLISERSRADDDRHVGAQQDHSQDRHSRASSSIAVAV